VNCVLEMLIRIYLCSGTRELLNLIKSLAVVMFDRQSVYITLYSLHRSCSKLLHFV